MAQLHLRVITPVKVVIEAEVNSVTVPAAEGEITILPHHINLFSLLVAGIIKIKKNSQEDYYAIGGGYLETDGEELNILVSRAYGQDQIDEKDTQRAFEQAKKTLSESKDKVMIAEAKSLLRRSLLDMKLVRKRKH